MAKRLGDHLRLFVHDASGTTYSQPAGQGNLTINRNDGTINLATKDNPRASAPSKGPISVSQAFIPDLPDAAYARMKTVAASEEAIVYQVREKPYANDDVVFECLMYTSFGNTDAGQGGGVGTSATLTAADDPTVDDI